MRIKENFIAFNTILRKEVVRFMRIWIQTLLPPAITMTLYFMIFGHFIGAQINPIEGFSYMQYIAPGLIMMSVVNNSYANVVSSFYGARFGKSIEEILVSPLPDSLMLIGYVAGGVLRGILVGLVVAIVSLFFAKLHIQHILMTFVVVILAAILFSLAGFTNSIFAKKFDDITIIPTFILTPLTYLGGVFYSIQDLPPFWQSISLFNPILYMINAFRAGVLGISDVNIHHAFGIIIFSILILFIVNLYLLRKGVGIRT